MPKPRTIATTAQGLLRFRKDPAAQATLDSRDPAVERTAAPLARYLVNPIAQLATRLAARSIAFNAFGHEYFLHDFPLGVEQAFPRFVNALSVASHSADPSSILAPMTSPPLLTQLRTNLTKSQQLIALSASVHTVHLRALSIRYGTPPPHTFLTLQRHYPDASRLYTFHNASRAASGFLYKNGALEWVFPVRTRLLARDVSLPRVFAECVEEVMKAGFSVRVETQIDADVALSCRGPLGVVEEVARRKLLVLFESGEVSFEDARQRNVLKGLEWRVADMDGAVGGTPS
ncbi:hypothetical protein BC830DRAFT_1158108 [Chytriomyces sp. MP71]|nr:hypothetical protein BC830DRAFT_1158108 [Chytriomyces sp. MP71]